MMQMKWTACDDDISMPDQALDRDEVIACTDASQRSIKSI